MAEITGGGHLLVARLIDPGCEGADPQDPKDPLNEEVGRLGGAQSPIGSKSSRSCPVDLWGLAGRCRLSTEREGH